jgi:hypothetical protein
LTDAKQVALDEVHQAAETFRQAQQATSQAREAFIDKIIEARDLKATQQEIAEQCVTDEPEGHLSRQRVAQFINERKQG